MLAGLVRRWIIAGGASWHVLTGYEAGKARRDVEGFENGAEDG